jgi:hypothetical protein
MPNVAAEEIHSNPNAHCPAYVGIRSGEATRSYAAAALMAPAEPATLRIKGFSKHKWKP